ncbi:MAG: methylmalonyl Co-A mutase-associated GTPase MeaB [Phototrophicales bacterium]|nr:MAG: methylmalonyl Co-A mutase-associated GTPase MeaB [Phototrophicales bacterium]
MSVTELVEKARAGHRRSLARLISYVENQTPEGAEVLHLLYPHTGHAYTVGVTGAPGTGKSCLVSSLTLHWRQQGYTVGIIAVDPSSPFTGGAVLGDRFRMREISGDDGVFIRSMASRGQLGGLARTTFDVMRIMDAVGFDFVVVETVGAGQNEVAIAKVANTTVLVEAPGLGDDIQAIKAGILEIADVIAVNKADRPGVKNTVRALKAMLELGHRKRVISHHGMIMSQDDGAGTIVDDMWMVPIVETIATEHKGIDALAEAIASHRAYLEESGTQLQLERMRLREELMDRLQTTMLKDLLQNIDSKTLDDVLDQMVSRQLDPESAVMQLLEYR